MLLSAIKDKAKEWAQAVYRFFSENPYGLSLTEVVFVAVVSNSALIFLVFTHLVDTSGARFSIGLARDVVQSAVSPSEVLVYLLAIISPALWIMAYSWRARRHVGFYWLLLMVQAVIVVGSAYIYGKAKSSAGVGNPDFVGAWALLCLMLGICVWYATLAYKRTVIDRVGAPRKPSGKGVLAELERSNISQGGEF